MKKCPYCSEEIQDGAVKCKYCGEWLNKVGKGFIFTYKAKNANGEYKNGTIEAITQKDALEKLEAQGLFVISIKMAETEEKKAETVEDKPAPRGKGLFANILVIILSAGLVIPPLISMIEFGKVMAELVMMIVAGLILILFSSYSMYKTLKIEGTKRAETREKTNVGRLIGLVSIVIILLLFFFLGDCAKKQLKETTPTTTQTLKTDGFCDKCGKKLSFGEIMGYTSARGDEHCERCYRKLEKMLENRR